MQCKHIVLVVATLLPFASSATGAPAPVKGTLCTQHAFGMALSSPQVAVIAVVGDDRLVRRQCEVGFKYTFCGGKDNDRYSASSAWVV